MTVSKRVAKSGAVTLPRQLRQETGILPGVPVDIEADEDGVHIRKHVPTCHFCGTVDDVKTVCGIEICRGCAEKIMEEFKDIFKLISYREHFSNMHCLSITKNDFYCYSTKDSIN